MKWLHLQGIQQNCSHLVICSFVDFYSCKLQNLGCFWKTQEICYMIGTRILKIDLEIAEIIEVKVATFNMEIIFCLCVIAKCEFLNDGCQLWPQLSQVFLNRFSKLLCLSCSKYPEFFKNVPTFSICMSRSQQKSK